MKLKLAFFLALLLPAAFLAAKEPDVFYCAHPSQYSKTAFVQKLLEMPEWGPFWTLFTDAVDKGVDKELTDPKKLEKGLPAPLAELIAKGVEKRRFSAREAVDEIFTHLQTVIVSVTGDDDDNEAEEIREAVYDLNKALAGTKKLDWEMEGVVALVLDVNPRKWMDVLEHFTEGKDYKFLKNESNGDFILEADIEHAGHEIEFCCASVKLPGEKRYALIFSDEDHIRRKFEEFKNGKTGEDVAKGYVKKLVLGERCFLFASEFGKQHGWAESATDLLGNVKRFESGVHDVDGVTQVEARLSLRKPENAKAVHDLLAGLAALVQLSQTADSKEEAKQVARFLQSVKLDLSGNDVALKVKLDHPDLWGLISIVLKKGTQEMMGK